MAIDLAKCAETVATLRNCGRETNCPDCMLNRDGAHCSDNLMISAADIIEELSRALKSSYSRGDVNAIQDMYDDMKRECNSYKRILFQMLDFIFDKERGK